MAGSSPTSEAAPQQPPVPDWPATGLFSGRSAWRDAVRAMILAATGQGVREMWWVAPHLADWPLDEPEVLDALTHWGRDRTVKLHWLCNDFELLRRAMPRLVRWRQQFSHVLSCKAPELGAASNLPTLLLVDRRVLLLPDSEHWRGRVSAESADLHHAKEAIDALLQRSEDSFAAVTLGL
jgi:hypothetical protein